MPIVNVQRRVDGNLVYGSVNEVTNEQNGETKPPQFNVPGAVAAPSDALLDSIGNLEVSIYSNFIDKHQPIVEYRDAGLPHDTSDSGQQVNRA